jgi:hypothetical protein
MSNFVFKSKLLELGLSHSLGKYSTIAPTPMELSIPFCWNRGGGAKVGLIVNSGPSPEIHYSIPFNPISYTSIPFNIILYTSIPSQLNQKPMHPSEKPPSPIMLCLREVTGG